MSDSIAWNPECVFLEIHTDNQRLKFYTCENHGLKLIVSELRKKEPLLTMKWAMEDISMFIDYCRDVINFTTMHTDISNMTRRSLIHEENTIQMTVRMFMLGLPHVYLMFHAAGSLEGEIACFSVPEEQLRAIVIKLKSYLPITDQSIFYS